MSDTTIADIRNGLVVYVAVECWVSTCGGRFGPMREPPHVGAFVERARARGWEIDETGRTTCPEHRQREEAMRSVNEQRSRQGRRPRE